MDALAIYLKELKNDHSNKEESIELIKKARSGDENAKEQLIKNYLLLVVKVAREYMNMGVMLEDLISEGNVGLLNALEKFDESKGAFSTCAKIWIKQSIIRNCMMKKRIVRLPENISNLMKDDRWKGLNYREISLDLPSEEGTSLGEKIADSTPTADIFTKEEDMLLKKKVENILSFLSKRDSEIVKACYGIGLEKPMDVEEIAEQYNLTTTRINQILRTSLKQMKITICESPDSTVKKVEIILAVYGSDDKFIDVSEKVIDLYSKDENIKSSNRLGGDPCFGTVKQLTITYIYDNETKTKSFKEGTIVKF